MLFPASKAVTISLAARRAVPAFLFCAYIARLFEVIVVYWHIRHPHSSLTSGRLPAGKRTHWHLILVWYFFNRMYVPHTSEKSGAKFFVLRNLVLVDIGCEWVQVRLNLHSLSIETMNTIHHCAIPCGYQ